MIVVSPEYDRARTYENTALLWRVAGVVDPRIEPIACGEVQWREDDGTPIIEIARREGVVVRLSDEEIAVEEIAK